MVIAKNIPSEGSDPPRYEMEPRPHWPKLRLVVSIYSDGGIGLSYRNAPLSKTLWAKLAIQAKNEMGIGTVMCKPDTRDNKRYGFVLIFKPRLAREMGITGELVRDAFETAASSLHVNTTVQLSREDAISPFSIWPVT